MTIEATSIVGRFDGTISYDDGAWGSFHCQIESFDLTNDSIWSLAESLSAENIQRVYGDANRKADFEEMFETLPFISSFVWSDTAKEDKVISDAVLHLYLLVTFDDGSTYPVSITHEKDEVRFHSESASASSTVPSAKIKSMLEKIMDSVTIS